MRVLNVEFKDYISVIQVILLILTAFCLPLLNMWFDNKLAKKVEELDKKYSSKETESHILKKLDQLTEQIQTLNNFLLENWNKKT